jgi:hypothetical protein
MRRSLIALVGCSFCIACGGGTPQPKDSDEVAGSKTEAPAQAAQSSQKSDEAAPSAPASAPSAEPSPAPAAASTAPAKSGDDDVWMAPHQMPQKDVLKAIKPAKAKVQACFKEGTKRDPSSQGEVKIRFVITNDGKVRAWRDDGSSMTDEEVTKCIGELVKTLTFPKQKSPGDAWGVYSANFGN